MSCSILFKYLYRSVNGFYF
ncbi:putative membrane protein, partial [Escherichia coli TW00353]